MPPPPSRWRDRIEIRKIRGNFRVRKMKKPVKAETTVNPPLLRSGIQNACTYSDTGCVGGSICAADAAAYIPVNTDAKVSTTQKDHPVGWSFCVVETTGTITPFSPHFVSCPRPSKKRISMRVFSFFHFCVYKLKMQIFRNFVYDSCMKRSKQNFFSMVYFLLQTTSCMSPNYPRFSHVSLTCRLLRLNLIRH